MGQVPVREEGGLFAAKILKRPRNSKIESMINSDMIKRRSQRDLKKNAKEVWHTRLEHPSQRMVACTIDDENYNLKEKMKGRSHQCKTCVQAKSRKARANGKLLGGSRDVTIHVDIRGP